MGQDIKLFCLSCEACNTSKPHTQAPRGLLHTLPIPTQPLVRMDFVGPFPPRRGYNHMLVVICRLTNMVALCPMRVTNTPSDVAWIYVRDIIWLHGMQDLIVSDRDTKFTSKFWRELHRLTGTKLMMSTLFHPQTDGATERAIRNVTQILRSFIDSTQCDWVYRVPMTEFTINLSISAARGSLPLNSITGTCCDLPIYPMGAHLSLECAISWKRPWPI
jgi:hypothetical protein